MYTGLILDSEEYLASLPRFVPSDDLGGFTDWKALCPPFRYQTATPFDEDKKANSA